MTMRRVAMQSPISQYLSQYGPSLFSFVGSENPARASSYFLYTREHYIANTLHIPWLQLDHNTSFFEYSMLLFVVQWTTISFVSWACWRILRRRVVKTDLDNVPGPIPTSYLKGSCFFTFTLCNLPWTGQNLPHRKLFQSI
jgi:hypothetical protein